MVTSTKTCMPQTSAQGYPAWHGGWGARAAMSSLWLLGASWQWWQTFDQIFDACTSCCCYLCSAATTRKKGSAGALCCAGHHLAAITAGGGWAEVQNLMMQEHLQHDRDGRGSLFVPMPTSFLLHHSRSITYHPQQPYSTAPSCS